MRACAEKSTLHARRRAAHSPTRAPEWSTVQWMAQTALRGTPRRASSAPSRIEKRMLPLDRLRSGGLASRGSNPVTPDCHVPFGRRYLVDVTARRMSTHTHSTACMARAWETARERRDTGAEKTAHPQRPRRPCTVPPPRCSCRRRKRRRCHRRCWARRGRPPSDEMVAGRSLTDLPADPDVAGPAAAR